MSSILDMHRYAQIDGNGRVISDSWLSGEVNKENMIPIAFDFDIKNKRYINGAWEDYIEEYDEKQEQLLSETEESIINTEMNVEYLVALHELGI